MHENTDHIKQDIRKRRIQIVSVVGILLLGILGLEVFFTFYPWPPLRVPGEIDLSTTPDIAHGLEKQIQSWQKGLFLETYAVTYQLDSTDGSAPLLTGQAHFRFAGFREDWLGRWLRLFNANHTIVRLDVNISKRKIADFSSSHGQPFGFDAPLNVTNWPVGESVLLQICDQHGGGDFKNTFQIDLAHVNASANRPGREWTVSYSASPQYFTCIVNLDTGDIQVKDAQSEWQSVGNLTQNR